MLLFLSWKKSFILVYKFCQNLSSLPSKHVGFRYIFHHIVLGFTNSGWDNCTKEPFAVVLKPPVPQCKGQLQWLGWCCCMTVLHFSLAHPCVCLLAIFSVSYPLDKEPFHALTLICYVSVSEKTHSFVVLRY